MEDRLRILFVEQEISYEPQGIMSMSAVLKQAGHDVALTVSSMEDPVAFAADYQPDVAAYSVMTGSQRAYFDLNLRIRDAVTPLRERSGRKPVVSVFGGPHPTFFPEMISEPGVDGLCIGEGEGAMLDLANALAARNGTYRTDIPNWWFNVDGEVIKNLPRPLIHELSALPHPDRALIYDKIPHLGQSKIKHFISSRGCPYACTYCFNHAYYQLYKREKRGQQRSVDDVIAEIKAVRARWPLEQAIFIDDLFVIYNDWLEEFAEKWPKEVGLPFFANVRANLIVKDPYKVELLKRAGCGTVSMGIEAANDRVRVELLKRRMTREEIIEAGRLVRAAGIHITATNILGLPTTTLEDDLDTMRLNAQAQMSCAHAFLFQPYPGTELGQFTEENADGRHLRRHRRGGLGSFHPDLRGRGRQARPRTSAAAVCARRRVSLAGRNDPPPGATAPQQGRRHAVLVGPQAAQGLCHVSSGAPNKHQPDRAVQDSAAFHENQELIED